MSLSKTLVTEHRDGTLSVDSEGLTLPEQFAAISLHYLDKAEVQLRLAKITKETGGSALVQARAEIAAERALAESDHWARHTKSRLRRKPETMMSRGRAIESR